MRRCDRFPLGALPASCGWGLLNPTRGFESRCVRFHTGEPLVFHLAGQSGASRELARKLPCTERSFPHFSVHGERIANDDLHGFLFFDHPQDFLPGVAVAGSLQMSSALGEKPCGVGHRESDSARAEIEGDDVARAVHRF